MNTRTMVDSGVNWIENIPKDWKVSRFSTLGKPLKNINKDFKEKNRLALTMKGVVRRPLDDNHGLQANDYSGYQIFEKNDWVFKLIDLQNIKTSRVGLVPERGIMSPAYIRVSSNKTSNEKFVYYTLYSAYLFNVFNDMGGGVRQTVGKEELMEFLLPLPCISEQQSIANFLDHHVSLIDREAVLIDKKIELLGDKRKSLIFECVTGKRTVVKKSSLTDSQNVVGHGDLVGVPTDPEKMMDSGVEWIGDIPREWAIKRVKDVFTLVTQKTSNQTVYIGMENIESNTGKKISDIDARVSDNGNDSKFLQGDVLFGKLRPYLQKVWLADVDGSCSTEFFVLRSTKNNKNNKKFFKNMFLSQNFCLEVNDRCGGVKMPRANWDDVGGMLISSPSLSTQNLISDFLHYEIDIIEEEISLLKRKQDLLIEKRKALIFEAVTGKIDCRSWTL